MSSQTFQLIVCVFLAVVAKPLSAQVRALEKGSQEAAIEIEKFRQRQLESARRLEKATVLLDERQLVKPTDTEIANYVIRHAAALQDEIMSAELRLAEIPKRKLKARAQADRTRLDAEATLLRDSLKRLKAGDATVRPQIAIADLKVGEFGLLQSQEVFFELVQVVDPLNMIVQWGGKQIWIADISTAGLVDGQDVRFANVLKVTGTKTYKSIVGGTRTVFLLQPMDVKAIEEKIAAAAIGGGQPDWRTWKTANGEFTAVAKLVAVLDEKISLELKNGTRIELKKRELTPNDQTYCEANKSKVESHNAVDRSTAPDERGEEKSIPKKANLPAIPEKTDVRQKWLNTSYDSTIYRVKDKQWAEIDNKTMKVKWYLEEKAITDQYVELSNEARKQTWRLKSTRMEFRDGANWKWISNGKWELP